MMTDTSRFVSWFLNHYRKYNREQVIRVMEKKMRSEFIETAWKLWQTKGYTPNKIERELKKMRLGV